MSGLRDGKVEKHEVHAPSSRAQVRYHGPQQFDVIGLAPIQSMVKCLNANRGFGFVIISEGSGDVFLHSNVLAEAGTAAVERGTVLKVRMAWKDEGLQVVEVLSVENNSIVPATQSFRRTSHWAEGQRVFLKLTGGATKAESEKHPGDVARLDRRNT